MVRPAPLAISVIVPALDEAELVGETLDSASDGVLEVIVADGGSRDGTRELARRRGARVIEAKRGRARQMNAGARAASGELLLFLHADTLLPAGFAHEVRRILAEPGVAAGAFRLGIAGESLATRAIERGANWRSRLLQRPYGDQALFLTATRFVEVGGFADLPIMEDYELVRRLRRTGRVRLASSAVRTSHRRWSRQGAVRTTVRNQLAVAAYLFGVDPERIARLARRNGQ